MTFEIQNLKVVNESKANVPIQTGIGYLDHMIDQLNSHAQVGVGLSVLLKADDNNDEFYNPTYVWEDKNRFASTVDQIELCGFVGSNVGQGLKSIIDGVKKENSVATTSRFCCPLDEGLVECIISDPSDDGSGQLKDYSLAPYGIYPKNVGRSKIGELETSAIESFWKSLAESSGLQLEFRKMRGDNGHHIVESSFKAFSRALRNLLDKQQYESGLLDTTQSPNNQASVVLQRKGAVDRSTKETSIKVELLLDGNGEGSAIDTGIPTLDEFFVTLAKEAYMTLNIQCKGDLYVDDHHTAEDVSIAVGQCLTQALGTKAGLNRMWLASDGPVEVTMDLSNRPCLRHNLHESLGKQEYVDENVDQANGCDGHKNKKPKTEKKCLLTCEMFEHVLDSLVMNSRMTAHIVFDEESSSASSLKEVVLCTGKAFGKALFACAMVDQRRAGQTASSKGTLSV